MQYWLMKSLSNSWLINEQKSNFKRVPNYRDISKNGKLFTCNTMI